ncbi:MAG: GNAT family N-acetyltransferase [Promethearchaeota archaeon]
MLNFDELKLEKLSEENLKEVYNFCEENMDHWSQPFEYFRLASILDSEFNENLTIVARGKAGEIVGFFMGTTRKGIPFYQGKNILKFFVIKRQFRRQGLATWLLKQLYIKFKDLGLKGRIDALCSSPDYWFPGVNLKFTPALYWLIKNGFKKQRVGGIRQNLYVELENNPYLKFDINNPPPSEWKKFKFMRVSERYFEPTYQFVKKHYGLGVWPEEVKLSFRNNPPTTFISVDKETDEIIGWATHSAHFNGSFGPTGVLKSLRGQGIGGILLNWTLYDLKQRGLKRCIIMWVVGNTVKYYSKVAGAYIGEVFWVMNGKIK